MRVAHLIVAITMTGVLRIEAQGIVQQSVVYRSPGGHFALTVPLPSQAESTFTGASLTLQPYSDAEFGATTSLYRIDFLGAAHCVKPDPSKPDQVCTPHVAVSLQLSSNVVDAVKTTVSSLRDYLISHKGAPLTLTGTALQGTTKNSDARQSWLAYRIDASLRAIPGTNQTGGFEPGGALTMSAGLQANIEFNATTKTDAGETQYPGTLVFVLIPTGSLPIGNAVRREVFAGTTRTLFVGGVDYRVGFTFQGEKPISLSAIGTFGAHGFKGFQNSVGLALSKALAL